jgi:hypothetical protein
MSRRHQMLLGRGHSGCSGKVEYQHACSQCAVIGGHRSVFHVPQTLTLSGG